MAVVNSNSNTVSVLLGNGDGTFASATSFPTGNNPNSLAVGDLDYDGIGDLVTANSGTGNDVSVLLGNGTGIFAAPVNYPAASSPSPLILADFDSNSKLDIAVMNYGLNKVSVLLNCSPVGIPDNSKKANAVLYPNPATGHITLESSYAEKQHVQISDPAGKIILNKTLSGISYIDVADLADGIYTIIIKTRLGIETKKLIIRK